MRWPKLRELKEAVTVVFSPRFTTRFPAEPCVVPESYRGKPEFDLDNCIGCGACVLVCMVPGCIKLVRERKDNHKKETLTIPKDVEKSLNALNKRKKKDVEKKAFSHILRD